MKETEKGDSGTQQGHSTAHNNVGMKAINLYSNFQIRSFFLFLCFLFFSVLRLCNSDNIRDLSLYSNRAIEWEKAVYAAENGDPVAMNNIGMIDSSKKRIRKRDDKKGNATQKTKIKEKNPSLRFRERSKSKRKTSKQMKKIGRKKQKGNEK